MAIRLSFGKHKGKSVRNLINEGEWEYLQWLLYQPFVKEKYPKLYKALRRKSEEIGWANYEEEYWGLTQWDLF